MTSPWPIPVTPLAPVACGAVLWRQAGVLGVTVVVKATFGLVHEATARMVAPVDIVREDRGRGQGCLDEASELAPYLPGAGVVLTGAAHAAGAPAPAVAVRLGVFRERTLVNKVLHVIGDRPREAPGSPRPFTSMPIVYERAFGGPAIEDNPVGTGAAPGSPLPNVIDPQHPHRPAGFGPVARRWGQRRRLLAGADASRVEPPYGEIPAGVDWAFFHAAPADQQVHALSGDEWIVLDGLHPSLPHLQSRLPSVRAHARWHLAGAIEPGPSRVLDLRADTLVITPESQICSLVWRGHIVLDQADAVSRLHVIAGVEMSGYTLAAALQHTEDEGDDSRLPTERIDATALRAPTADEPRDPLNQTERLVAAKLRLPDLPFSKANITAAMPVTSAPTGPTPRLPAPGGSLQRTVDAVISPFASVLPFQSGGRLAPDGEQPSPWATPEGEPRPSAALGPNVAGLPFKAPIRVEDPESHTSMIDLRELQTKAVAPFAISEPGATPDAAAAVIPGAPWSAVPAATRAFADSDEESTVVHQIPVREALPPLVPPPPPSQPAVTAASTPAPPIPPAELPAAVLPPSPPSAPALVVTMGEPPKPPAETLAGAAPAQAAESGPLTGLRATVVARLGAREPLLDLDLAGADLRGVDLTGAGLARMNLRGAKLAGCKLAGARLVGAQLGEADLTGADLAGADLGHADLARATLAGTRFDGATLTDANLAEAQGPGASFVSATATRACFARGRWEEASFARAEATGADFNAASLAAASFEGATLVEARFDEARAQGAVLTGARLGQARAVGAKLAGASLRGADAPGSVWEKATLDDASFAGANLKEANLARASCLKTSFAGADLGGANLQRLVGDGADLRDARLAGVDLRQARLHGASFDGACLREAQANKADLTGSRFVRADLQGATLRGARLTGASFAHAQLEGADLRDADLEGANVFGASRKTAKLGAGTRGLIEVDPGESELGAR